MAEDIMQKLDTICSKLDAQANGSSIDDIIRSVASLREIFHDAVSINGLHSQIQSILRGLSERIGQSNSNYEQLLRAINENHDSIKLMAEYFKIMADRLDDIIKCPFPNAIEKLRGLHGLIKPSGSEHEKREG